MKSQLLDKVSYKWSLTIFLDGFEPQYLFDNVPVWLQTFFDNFPVRLSALKLNTFFDNLTTPLNNLTLLIFETRLKILLN